LFVSFILFGWLQPFAPVDNCSLFFKLASSMSG